MLTSELDLLDTLYAGVLEPQGWQDFLASLCRRTGARAAFMRFDSDDPDKSPHSVAWGATKRLLEKAASRALDSSLPATPIDLSGADGMTAHRVRSGRDMVLVAVEPGFGAVLLLRGRAGTAWERTDMADAMLPHILRAGRLAGLAIRKAQAHNLLTEAMNGLPFAHFLIDRNRRIVFANHTGRRLLDRGQGLRSDDGALAPDDPDSHAALARAVGAAFRGRAARNGARAVVIKGGANANRIAYLWKNADAIMSLGSPTEFATVIVPESQLHPGAAADPLRRRFDLTEAENNLAAALARGETIRAYALRRGLSVHTLRVQLRSIFKKTDTHRQADLVRVLLSPSTGDPRGRKKP